MPNYVLTVKLDPSQLNAQLRRIQEAFGGGGSQKSQNGDLKGVLGRFQNAIAGIAEAFSGGKGGKLAAFGLMSLGIMELVKIGKSIVGAVVDSSPVLKSMMQLLNTGIMFMLRPIGDFIGFMLRPILLIFMRYIAIPFYRYMAPWMQRYGTAVGDGISKVILVLLNFFNNPGKTFADAFKSVFNFAVDIGGKVTDWLKTIKVPTFEEIFKGLDNLKAGWDTLTSFFGGLSTTVKLIYQPIVKIFSDFFLTLRGGIISTLKPVWDFLVAVFKDILKGADLIWGFFQGVGGIFKGIANFFVALYNGVLGWLKGLPIIGGFFSRIPNAKGFASGGLITEPVIGVGTRSGQAYKFGESGTERVSKFGSGGGVGTVNINIYGGDINQIRDVVLRVIQESGTRRRRI